MQIVYSNVATKAATLLQAWKNGGFSSLRAHSECASLDSGSLLDLERRDLLNAIIQQMEEAGGDAFTCGDTELPNVRVEACLNLLRHLGSPTDR